LVEDYGCPVIVLAERDAELSGSARSVSGANIVEAIASQEKILLGYGGHNMAAGLRLEADKLFEFRRGISQVLRDMLGKEIIQPELKIDAFVQFPEINLDFADDIARLAPFGNGNPALTLATEKVKIKSRRKMGNRGDHLDLIVEDMLGAEQRVVWWFGDIDELPEGYFDLAYTVRSNVYKGKRSALIEWIGARVPEDKGFEPRKASYQVIDYRQASSPEKLLESIQHDYEDIVIWSEGDSAVKGLNRYQLAPAKTLVVWTIPPDIVTWRTALEMVQPETLILFNKTAPFQEAKAFVSQIVGLAKYAQRTKASLIHLSEIAALTGQSEQSVFAALRWIHANTEMRFIPAYDDAFRIEIDNHPAPKNISIQTLKKHLDETSAYRQFWLKQNFLA
jgi:single-stranded-DNA-specific exonuclease